MSAPRPRCPYCRGLCRRHPDSGAIQKTCGWPACIEQLRADRLVETTRQNAERGVGWPDIDPNAPQPDFRRHNLAFQPDPRKPPPRPAEAVPSQSSIVVLP